MSDAFSRSVTAWIDDLKAGKDEAAQQLWNRYFDRLVRVARRKLGPADRRVSDEEDLAISVFHALCQGSAAGRFEKLNNRDDLWSLLVAITGKKAVDQVRRQTSQKRGAGKVRGHSVFAKDLNAEGDGFEQIIAAEPTSDFLAKLDEEHNHLLQLLRDENQRSIVRFRLAGFDNQEIAARMGISLRSVERKIKTIRDSWSGELQS